MAAINYDLVRWPLRKWVFALVVILALHLGLLWKFSGPPPDAREVTPDVPLIEMSAGERLRSAMDPVELEDPLLFASAHPKGFSGSAWVRKPQRNYALQTRLPAQTFLDRRIARTLLPEQLESPTWTAPHIRRARLPLIEVAQAQPNTPGRSELLMEGSLSERQLRTPVQLPVQRHSDVLGRTVVEAAVSADGFVLAARVISSCGSRKADQEALTIARGLRFEPLSLLPSQNLEGKLTWGKLIFDWFTVDLGGNNAAAQQ